MATTRPTKQADDYPTLYKRDWTRLQRWQDNRAVEDFSPYDSVGL